MPAKKSTHLPWYTKIRWDYLYERRKQLLFLFFALILFVWIVSVFVSKGETTSVSQTAQAERIVAHLTRPPPTDQKIAYEKELDSLLDLLSHSPSLASRFSGIAAQEEILQKRDLSEKWFEMAGNTLEDARLPVYKSIVQATLYSEQNETEKAFIILDTILSNNEIVPKVRFYVLFQKAFILKKLHRSNDDEIEGMKKIIETDPDISGLFDVWVRDSATNVLAFLKES